MPRKRIIKASKPQSPADPLDPKREAFCAAVVNGLKLRDAHKVAGYTGQSQQAAWNLRHTPEVDARIQALLKSRVSAQAVAFARRQKGSGDLLARVVKELEDIAFQDVREIVDWRREAVMNAAGEVIDMRETMQLRDSAKLTPSAAKAVKGVFRKGDSLRLELHDKRAALETLAKILKGDDVATTQTTTNVQINVGAAGAVDAVQRIAFLLASATSRQPAAPPPVTIDAKPTDHNS